eukprot:10916974-Ditylum_brightwellii.AAC.1
MEDVNNKFLEQAWEAHTPLKGKKKAQETGKQGEKLLDDINNDLTVLRHVKVSLPSKMKEGWKSGQEKIPPVYTMG